MNTGNLNSVNSVVSHQTLGCVDHAVIKCPGRDLVEGDDGVSTLQLSFLQQLLTCHLERDRETERERDRDTQRDTERDTERHTQRKRQY